MPRKKKVIDEIHVKSLKVVGLKKLCSKYKLSQTGIKSNLRKRILEHLKLGKYAKKVKKTVKSTENVKQTKQKAANQQHEQEGSDVSSTTKQVQKGDLVSKKVVDVEMKVQTPKLAIENAGKKPEKRTLISSEEPTKKKQKTAEKLELEPKKPEETAESLVCEPVVAAKVQTPKLAIENAGRKPQKRTLISSEEPTKKKQKTAEKLELESKKPEETAESLVCEPVDAAKAKHDEDSKHQTHELVISDSEVQFDAEVDAQDATGQPVLVETGKLSPAVESIDISVETEHKEDLEHLDPKVVKKITKPSKDLNSKKQTSVLKANRVKKKNSKAAKAKRATSWSKKANLPKAKKVSKKQKNGGSGRPQAGTGRPSKKKAVKRQWNSQKNFQQRRGRGQMRSRGNRSWNRNSRGGNRQGWQNSMFIGGNRGGGNRNSLPFHGQSYQGQSYQGGSLYLGGGYSVDPRRSGGGRAWKRPGRGGYQGEMRGRNNRNRGRGRNNRNRGRGRR